MGDHFSNTHVIVFLYGISGKLKFTKQKKLVLSSKEAQFEKLQGVFDCWHDPVSREKLMMQERGVAGANIGSKILRRRRTLGSHASVERWVLNSSSNVILVLGGKPDNVTGAGTWEGLVWEM